MSTSRKKSEQASAATMPADSVYRYTFTVPESDIDGNGHVNNVAYVQWMQDVAVRHFRDSGGEPLMEAAGATWVARSHRIEYLRPGYPGDDVEARTWITSFSRVRSVRCYAFVRTSDDALLARGETEWVFVNATTGRPKAIPDSITSLFSLVSEGKLRT